MKEENIIKEVCKNLPRSIMQYNSLFESDAEIIEYNNNRLCFNIDEYSSEDLFIEDNAYYLGWNIAVATISDILAVGGVPKFFAHSMSVSNKWSQEYIKSFSKGIGDVLKELKCYFIGGDTSITNHWKYTGWAMGEVIDKPLLRSEAIIGDAIYITGKVGLGNIQAAANIFNEKLDKIKFKILLEESKLISKYSKCAIDTSDGLFNSIQNISKVSDCGFILENIVYEKIGFQISKKLSIPIEALMLGECGEYQLLFTIDESKINEFEKEYKSKKFEFYKIGKILDNNQKLIRTDSKLMDFRDFNLKARDYENKKNYLSDLIKYINKRVN